MHPVAMTIKDDHRIAETPRALKLLAAGGILAALGAASCCVVPFPLFMLGVSGAWIANLTALEPKQLHRRGPADWAAWPTSSCPAGLRSQR